ncbi:hypothetical protein HPT27_15080 [Permianibacter sp. IMCC34836]|uniref:hypothetical protein n=1 Tax=Permianibacter fluminis TaxID=2738515 RepID=UPI0015516EF8|nr:hypothetical protein [Permianibacter fluminis]NQD38349.1 hypothetical protein [Permianibacter fluminis]
MSLTNLSFANVLFAALLLASFAGKQVQADQNVDLNSCVSTADNQIEVEEDEAGNPAPSPACLTAVAGSEINWQQANAKEFKIKFVKHSGGQCNDSADDDGKEHDSNNGKLKKKGPSRAGCFHYRIKFKGGEWIDPVIVIRPN